MKPYYQDSYATIFLGDCQEVLPTIERVDLVVSSPPYNQIAKRTPSGLYGEYNRKLHHAYASHSDAMKEVDYMKWMQSVFGKCLQIFDGLVWINHKTRIREKSGVHPLHIFRWPFHSEIIWDRLGSISFNQGRFAQSHEFIYGFGTPSYWDNSTDALMSVWRINPETSIDDHPCPFPLEIPLRLIRASCKPRGIVLDPFMGSGTTLVAAKQLGRKAIGIEIEEKYCEIAAIRLQQEYLPLTVEPVRKEIQAELIR